MKVNAISLDGTRVKDFMDIYFLLDKYSIEEMLGFFEKKYSLQNSFHALKSLNFFNDVNVEVWPQIIKEKDLKWEDVKRKIEKAVNNYVKSLKRLSILPVACSGRLRPQWCEFDVKCKPYWDNESDAVAFILHGDGIHSFIGSLINNPDHNREGRWFPD